MGSIITNPSMAATLPLQFTPMDLRSTPMPNRWTRWWGEGLLFPRLGISYSSRSPSTSAQAFSLEGHELHPPDILGVRSCHQARCLLKGVPGEVEEGLTFPMGRQGVRLAIVNRPQ